MKKKSTKLTIDTVLFKEGGRYHVYSPQLQLADSSKKKVRALEGLRDMSLAQLNFWQERSTLLTKIEELGLGRISAEKRKRINHDLTVPYSFLRRKKSTFGKISLTVDL